MHSIVYEELQTCMSSLSPGGAALIITGIITVLVVSAVIWKLLQTTDPYSSVVAHWRFNALDVIDEDDTPVDGKDVTRLVRIAVAHARVELGLLSNTPANVMVVSDVIRKFMKNHGLRPTHISAHFPTAVRVYFLRSSMDDELHNMCRSAAYQKYARTSRQE